MTALFKKEVVGFFSSLTGYLVVIVFLLTTGLFMWVIPGDNNVLDKGYADMETFFVLAPWIFMFLIPAITMKLFADEKKAGTLDLLFTRPISDLGVVWSKYLAALTITVLAILPTLMYFLSVYLLGNPLGNMDVGGTWGSYIGLILLAAVYVSIGIFGSSLTENSIVAFILSMVFVFLFFYGFDAASMLLQNKKGEFYLQGMSIFRHYKSISRGVADTRDLIYFFSVIAVFITATKIKLQSRKW
ncbi:MAG TPA: gliding motility-associated ABC transporter permease subunit GldF [Marinilabiliales bacterium]|nr:MAG: gliding motility-associated ABC transporter permease subunit GldF [Bacteroidetes bacterium GWA2_40_14]OFX61334.1 MAG: gliding motility-associated ABC transporter permease subunit GldF [Bacteroidetes bacterium GWC2_40_13]OFX75911.1 MAG: gliding motility-associated ABC transporter permease subunit GldF [Bacteroidetes bacterium GWD2_40_43]OFX90614.1 MAG: gliding motility-associated ABC transporter permease subunit GldF [Bacteroidetes bacterium GWE2_40_63]OFY20908.1 MAG: gliding motility-as